MRCLSAVVLAGLAACGSDRIPPVRFANRPAVTVVNDREDVAARPATNELVMWLYHFDGSFFRLLTRALELPGQPRALGVNALDEVPDSTWFTNRIGKRDLTVEEVRRANARLGSPESHEPWTVHSTKIGGESLGFIVSDARGKRFLLKFDRAGVPEMETAAQIIAGKLLWAAGFNVTEDHIVAFDPSELLLAADAAVKQLHGRERPLDRAELDHMLSTVERDARGHIRGMASWWLDGKAIGGHAATGVRADDPNDRIPHERRRDLRGARAVFAWLDHIDVKQDNTLDMWVSDPRDPARHYVVHHWVDYGKSLGVMAVTGADIRRGFEHKVDLSSIASSLVTGGLERRPWESRRLSALRGVGVFSAHDFDPATWKADTPAYVPFRAADDRDLFWGARIVMRFTREQIRAVVDTARLSDPAAAAYITNTLVARQRAVGRHWFSRIPPLDRFAIADRALCFDDLLLHYGLSPLGSVTSYRLVAFGHDGKATGTTYTLTPDERGHACTPPLRLAARRDGYTIFEIETRRANTRGKTYVHVARDTASGVVRVVGIWRP